MGGKQRWDGLPPKRRLAGEGDVVHHVALLLLQRGGYGHQPFRDVEVGTLEVGTRHYKHFSPHQWGAVPLQGQG